MGGCARERSRRRIRSAPGAQPQPSSPEAPHPTGRRARPQIFFWEPVRTGTPAERPIFTRRSARPAVATKCEARAADIGGDHAAFPERGAPAAGRQPADIKLRRRASVQRHGCWRGGQGVDMGRPRSEVKIRSGPLLPLDNALLILKKPGIPPKIDPAWFRERCCPVRRGTFRFGLYQVEPSATTGGPALR